MYKMKTLKEFDWILILKFVCRMFLWFAIIAFIFVILAAYGSAQLYNTTNLTNANNFYDQALALNDITAGLVGYSIILVVTGITFIITASNFDTLAGLGAGSFIGALTSTILLPLGLISFNTYQLTLIITGISVVLSMLLRR